MENGFSFVKILSLENTAGLEDGTLLYSLLVCDDDAEGIGLAAAIGGDGFG